MGHLPALTLRRWGLLIASVGKRLRLYRLRHPAMWPRGLWTLQELRILTTHRRCRYKEHVSCPTPPPFTTPTREGFFSCLRLGEAADEWDAKNVMSVTSPNSPIRFDEEQSMDYVMQSRIHDFVVATLRELGVANPRIDAISMRILTKDGCYAGQVAQCEHIRVFFSEDGQIVQFFGPGNVVLKKVSVGQIAA
jgi:hypothetical protein